MSDELRMDAYYYSFEETGQDAVDLVLSAVACAGKAYHHTEDWNESCGAYHSRISGGSPREWIQNAANDAAKALADERAISAAAIRERDELLVAVGNREFAISAANDLIEELRGQRDELVTQLESLFMLVKGECPSLLDEDSGGGTRGTRSTSRRPSPARRPVRDERPDSLAQRRRHLGRRAARMSVQAHGESFHQPWRCHGLFAVHRGGSEMSDEKPKHTPGPLGVAIWNDGRTDPVEQFRQYLGFGGGRIWGVWAPEHPLTVGSHPNPEHAVMTCVTGNGPAAESNAYLYAAATDLLEELRGSLEVLQEYADEIATLAADHPDDPNGAEAVKCADARVERARAAIARAEGRE